MIRRILRRTAFQLALLQSSLEHRIAQATLPTVRGSAKRLRIDRPRRITNSSSIEFGDDVNLGPNCFLQAIKKYPGPAMGDFTGDVQDFDSEIIIGNRVSATGALTIAAFSSVVVEDDVLFASNINLTDGLHGYSEVEIPYKYQPICRIAPIRVGAGCWIGENVMVMPGVSIGQMSIIGANSVVTESIPPYSIAFGAPARVRKRWDKQSNDWILS